ncbi:hypothetical protein ZIOFF_022257 [Zingiber officinale]|uniref:Uncharacterized protein n=1 Tax=Zingiber officinale TaxID=94328 RepID=A0A8J5L952_ZINOF|nr:hypothetical protein ZIOFF_022257 [Zingiber officinale]
MTATTTRKPWKTVVFTNFLLVSTLNLMKYKEGLLGDFLSHPLVKYLPKSEEKKDEGVSCSEKGVPVSQLKILLYLLTLQITSAGLMISLGFGAISATSLAIHETCWKIHGKPANWKNSKQGEKNRGIPTANEADTGSNPKALHMSKALSCLNSSPWIIDSGATDHMSSCSHPFDTYSPCSGNEKIRIVDELADLERRLAKEFQIKDLGALKHFLGMEFARSKEDVPLVSIMEIGEIKSPSATTKPLIILSAAIAATTTIPTTLSQRSSESSGNDKAKFSKPVKAYLCNFLDKYDNPPELGSAIKYLSYESSNPLEGRSPLFSLPVRKKLFSLHTTLEATKYAQALESYKQRYPTRDEADRFEDKGRVCNVMLIGRSTRILKVQ